MKTGANVIYVKMMFIKTWPKPKTKGIFRASAMPLMELFETLVDGLSILDYCRQELRPRGWEGPESGSENKCKNHLFKLIFKFV